MKLEDVYSSFKDYLKERTNGFFGTVITVWIIYNWKVVYAFFFFDKSYDTLEKRQQYFVEYWEGNFLYNLLAVIGISITVYIVALILKYVAKLITNFFVDIVGPMVFMVTKKSNVIEYEKYELEVERNSKLEIDIINERAARIKAEREKEEIERNYKSAEYQLKVNARNQVINTLKDIDEFGAERLVEFFKNLSEHQFYHPNEFIERMLRRYIVVIRERQDESYKLMITEYGDKIRELIRLYKGL